MTDYHEILTLADHLQMYSMYPPSLLVMFSFAYFKAATLATSVLQYFYQQ